MAKNSINPFQNESETLQISELTIENRLDRVSFYGSLDITKDKEGLANAQQLMDILGMVVMKLDGENLPDQVTVEPTDSVKNPFF
jgi:hypothetical protein